MSQHARAKDLHVRYQEVLRYLAVLVERAGGEVLILQSELEINRGIRKQEKVGGAVHLRVERR